MTGWIVRYGRHRCDPPSCGHQGDIWECECGRRWRYCAPGNPNYEGFTMTWLSSLGLHRRSPTPPTEGDMKDA